MDKSVNMSDIIFRTLVDAKELRENVSLVATKLHRGKGGTKSRSRLLEGAMCSERGEGRPYACV